MLLIHKVPFDNFDRAKTVKKDEYTKKIRKKLLR